jgi:hypothetical protein
MRVKCGATTFSIMSFSITTVSITMSTNMTLSTLIGKNIPRYNLGLGSIRNFLKTDVSYLNNS